MHLRMFHWRQLVPWPMRVVRVSGFDPRAGTDDPGLDAARLSETRHRRNGVRCTVKLELELVP